MAWIRWTTRTPRPPSARLVAHREVDAGIVIDGAGLGSAIAANKIHGVRAAMCTDKTLARYLAGAQRRQRPGLGRHAHHSGAGVWHRRHLADDAHDRGSLHPSPGQDSGLERTQ